MDKLTKDAMNMLEITEKTADRADIWQDRFVYWIAVAVYHLIIEVQVKMHVMDKRIKDLEDRR